VLTEQAKEELKHFFNDMVNQVYSNTPCTSCSAWESGTEQCGLVKVRPPAPVIVSGCPKWCPLIIDFLDDIPF
jgi:hypothetical protein